MIKNKAFIGSGLTSEQAKEVIELVNFVMRDVLATYRLFCVVAILGCGLGAGALGALFSYIIRVGS